MAESGDSSGPGGFVIPTLPSPAPSATSTTRSISGLPHPRGHALRPGSAKEDKVRNYIDDRLMYINRRWVKKHGLAEPGDEVIGYKSMGELCKDLEPLINIIWLSGTRRLLIAFPFMFFCLTSNSSQPTNTLPAKHRQRIHNVARLLPAIIIGDLFHTAKTRPRFC